MKPIVFFRFNSPKFIVQIERNQLEETLAVVKKQCGIKWQTDDLRRVLVALGYSVREINWNHQIDRDEIWPQLEATHERFDSYE